MNALSKLGKINASPRYAPSDVNIGAARLRIILTALEIPYAPNATKNVLMNKLRIAIGFREASS